MELQSINWKLYLDEPDAADPDQYFKVFNTWIPDSPEVFLDVADYKHVHDGPVILLVGHYLNHSLDATDRRLGLLCDYKQPMEGSNAEKLRAVLLHLLRAAKRLEADASLSPKPRFRTGELRLIVNNRALAPNLPETFAALGPDLEAVFSGLYGAGAFALKHVPDPRLRFAVDAVSDQAPGLDELLRRLA